MKRLGVLIVLLGMTLAALIRNPQAGRRHLPERGCHRPPDRRRAAGGQRRMAAPAPLHDARDHERSRQRRSNRQAHPARRQSGLTGEAMTNTRFTPLTDVTRRIYYGYLLSDLDL